MSLNERPAIPSSFLLASKSVEQFEQRVFALTAHGVVNVACIQCCVAVDRREVAAPHDRNFGVQATNLAATFDCGSHLRTRHHRYAQHFDFAFLDQPREWFPWDCLEISVDDLVIFPALQDCAESKHGERQAPVTRSCGAWVV